MHCEWDLPCGQSSPTELQRFLKGAQWHNRGKLRKAQLHANVHRHNVSDRQVRANRIHFEWHRKGSTESFTTRVHHRYRTSVPIGLSRLGVIVLKQFQKTCTQGKIKTGNEATLYSVLGKQTTAGSDQLPYVSYGGYVWSKCPVWAECVNYVHRATEWPETAYNYMYMRKFWRYSVEASELARVLHVMVRQ